MKRSSKLVKLRPILDNGLVRVTGRIGDSPVTPDARFPMIVPPNYPPSDCIIASETRPCRSKSHSCSTEREGLGSKR